MSFKSNNRKPHSHLGLVKNDPWLEPFEKVISDRHEHVLQKLDELTHGSQMEFKDFADGYLYFGLHKTNEGWVFREWAPNATEIYVIGDFNGWQENVKYKMKSLKNGNWEINFETCEIFLVTEQ